MEKNKISNSDFHHTKKYDERNICKSEKIVSYIVLSAIFLFLGILVFFLCSCTNVVMTHTEGSASDTVEDAQHVNPNVSPTLNVPETPIGNLIKK